MLLALLLACPAPITDGTPVDTDTGSGGETGQDTDTGSGGETGQDTDTGADTDTDTGGDSGEALTFANTLYPVWAEDCGDCHGGWGPVGDPKVLWENLLSKGPDGPPIVAGDRSASQAYLKLLDGVGGLEGQRMPMVLSYLSDSQVAELGAWIDAGAVKDSTWTGIYRTMWEERKCGMCHQEWGGFKEDDVHAYLTTNSVYGGPLIEPGNAANSLVYQRLSSTANAEDRMPVIFDFVDDVTIERIGQWIDEGAVFE